MKRTILYFLAIPLIFVGLQVRSNAFAGVEDPLPSWNDGSAKAAILKFIGEITREDSPGYVPPAERIAVFDNDGTLWS